MQDIDDKYFKSPSNELDKVTDEFFDVESKRFIIILLL